MEPVSWIPCSFSVTFIFAVLLHYRYFSKGRNPTKEPLIYFAFALYTALPIVAFILVSLSVSSALQLVYDAKISDSNYILFDIYYIYLNPAVQAFGSDFLMPLVIVFSSLFGYCVAIKRFNQLNR